MRECWNGFFNSTGTTKLTYLNYLAYSKRKACHFSYLCKAFLLSNCLWATSLCLTAVLGSTVLILLLVCILQRFSVGASPSGFSTCFCFGELLSMPHLHTRLLRTHLLRTEHWMWIVFFSFIFISWRLITLQYCSGFCHTLTWSAMDLHVFPNPIPHPTSLSTRFPWVFPVHQARALVSCIQPGLVICFTLDNIHVSMLFSRNIPPLPSPTESKSLFCTSVSLFLFYI